MTYPAWQLTCQDLARSFLCHLRAQGLSPATLRLYGQFVRFFSRWLEAEGPEGHGR